MRIILGLDNNFKDIYRIVLKDKIDFQDKNLKVIHSLLFKINCNRNTDFDKSNFDFLYQTLKLTSKFLKLFLNLSKTISNGP